MFVTWVKVKTINESSDVSQDGNTNVDVEVGARGQMKMKKRWMNLQVQV